MALAATVQKKANDLALLVGSSVGINVVLEAPSDFVSMEGIPESNFNSNEGIPDPISLGAMEGSPGASASETGAVVGTPSSSNSHGSTT